MDDICDSSEDANLKTKILAGVWLTQLVQRQRVDLETLVRILVQTRICFS